MTTINRPSFHLAAALFAAFVFALFASAPVRAEIHCAGGHCSCTGDKDCNTMFTHLCTDTGGSCEKTTDTCSCTQKAAVSSGGSGGTIKKHPVGAATTNTMKQQ
jgi:hypothetical protein